MQERMKRELELKKNELAQRQEYFMLDIEHEMNTVKFERNAIHSLMTMMKLKTEIQQIEYELEMTRISN